MQFDRLKRREFITLLGGGAASWPIMGRAQQATMPMIGFLNGGSPELFAPYVDAFLLGLNEAGFVKDRNCAIAYRWARGRYDELPSLAAELVQPQGCQPAVERLSWRPKPQPRRPLLYS